MSNLISVFLCFAMSFVAIGDAQAQDPASIVFSQQNQAQYSDFPMDAKAESGIYVGGHFRRERLKTVTKLKTSGFNYVILFNIDVQADGTLKTDGETICKDGVYVFDQTQPNYINDVNSLKQGSTSITRVEVCIGGWENQSWFKIKDLITAQGTGQTSILYKNFAALKKAIPSIDAINNDDEHAYDVNSATAFHVMMYDLGYYSTVAPYMQKNYWKSLVNNVNAQRPGAVRRVYIQCYDGGAGNNPADWHFGEIPLHGGRLNYQNFTETLTVMKDWKANKQVTGGFFWVYNDETWSLSKYALSVNRIFNIASSPVATFYSEKNYTGYVVGLPAGEYTTANLADYGIEAKDISSIKVQSGYRVTVYTMDNFSYTSKSYATDAETLVYDNLIASVKIEQVVQSGIDDITGNGELPAFSVDNINNRLLIETLIPDHVTIFDMSGKEVCDATLLQGHNAISLTGVFSGSYIALLKTEKKSFRFVVQ